MLRATTLLILFLAAPPAIADDAWTLVPVPADWGTSSDRTLSQFDGVAWYRTFVIVPESWDGVDLTLRLGRVDDADETFFNGTRIGGHGAFPPDARTAWNVAREYTVPASTVFAGRPNLIAVRVHDSGGAGGITAGPLSLIGPDGEISLGGGSWLFRAEDDAGFSEWPSPPDSITAVMLAREYLATQGKGAIAPGGGLLIAGRSEAPEGHRILWYRRPAGGWTEALPVGNGRLGAMVHGRPEEMHLQLNEESVWAGAPLERDREGAHEAYTRARTMILEGKVVEAQALLQSEFMTERRTRSHQTLGDLRFRSPAITEARDYRRSLDLATGIARVEYRSGAVTYSREVFSSTADDALVVRLVADVPGSITGRLVLDRSEGATVGALPGGMLVLTGQADHGGNDPGTHFEARAQLRAEGGTIRVHAGEIEVRGADALTIVLVAATDFRGGDPPSRNLYTLARLERHDAAALRSRHVRDHQQLFDRVSIDLGGSEWRSSPTDERLSRVRAGASDPDLLATYFQFGRYLLMGSSRPGGLPANLQGIWNPHIAAPWNADYHLNINLQMNYWAAEVAALPECHTPLFDYIERLRVRGRATAREHYDAPGWMAHHTSDIWAFTSPIGRTVWGLWPYGGAWLCRHLWEHYQYGGDLAFLRDRAWPTIAEACEFHLHTLFEDPDTGRLIAGPSSSPENSFRTDEGTVADVEVGNAMDQEIIADLFDIALAAAAALGEDDPRVERIRAARRRLALPRLGADGRVLEWRRPLTEVEPGHRHMSHLYALHPGELWTAESAPEFLAAARRTLEHRLANGGGHTGWSRAWLVNFRARLGEGAAVAENLDALLAKSTHPNLLDDHPPFQIDGNFGGTAGIAEALVQSHGGVLRLLPALPPEWPNGSVRGLRTRFGVTVDLEWRDGSATAITLRRTRPGSVPILLGERRAELPEEDPGVLELASPEEIEAFFGG